ncbi:type II toxin-antitoxin system HicB family antitoxin [Mesorhizobium caraganae]|nr:type II toxin-antitoxin system HicB family antitoxin [Mesorhizobium caraganae]
MRQYIGLIHKDAESDVGVSFPDFPGLVTAGEDLDDARGMAEEALAFHIQGPVELRLTAIRDLVFSPRRRRRQCSKRLPDFHCGRSSALLGEMHSLRCCGCRA